MKCTDIAALIMSCAVPLEIWAGGKLLSGEYLLAIPLIAAASGLNFFGIRAWIRSQTREIKNGT